MSPRLLPVDLEAQLVPGSFAHALHHLVDTLDVSAFDAHYRNDEVGASAHAPAMLLNAVLLDYSQGTISSLDRARVSRQRAVHCPDRRCQAAFHHDHRFHQPLARCDRVRVWSGVDAAWLGAPDRAKQGRRRSCACRHFPHPCGSFAIDGVKLPSNASKHRSGTRAKFLAQAQKMERAAKVMLDRHSANDAGSAEEVLDAQATARIERLTCEAAKVRQWLSENPTDRLGSRGAIRKSNRTDNESAKLATDKGVIQGYCGVAVVNAAHQVIVEASAHGTGAEQELRLPVIDACADQPHQRR